MISYVKLPSTNWFKYLLRFWGKNFRVVIRNNRRFDPSKGVCLEIVLNMEK